MKNQDLKHLYQSIYDIKYHLVFVTKYRKKCINQMMLKRLKDIFQDLCLKWEAELLEFNGEEDHVHLLISSSPKTQPTKLINNLKTVSARLIRKEFQDHLKHYFWKPIFWSRSYCILSCGGAPLTIIKQYIENQKSIE